MEVHPFETVRSLPQAVGHDDSFHVPKFPSASQPSDFGTSLWMFHMIVTCRSKIQFGHDLERKCFFTVTPLAFKRRLTQSSASKFTIWVRARMDACGTFVHPLKSRTSESSARRAANSIPLNFFTFAFLLAARSICCRSSSSRPTAGVGHGSARRKQKDDITLVGLASVCLLHENNPPPPPCHYSFN